MTGPSRRGVLLAGGATALFGARAAAGRKARAFSQVVTDGVGLVSRATAVTIGSAPATAPIVNQPAQAAGIFWADTGDASNDLASGYARPGGLVSVGRTNYADQVFKDVSAAGGTVLVYLDPIIPNPFGRYADLLFNSSVYGAAVPLWPPGYPANSWGSLGDFRTAADGGGIMQGKLEAVLELIVSENPHIGGFFLDDVGSRSWFPNLNWTTFPDKAKYRTGAIAAVQTARTVADRHGLMVIVNGTWTAGDGGGYPNTALDGCSLAEGGYIEHHDGEISFWGPYASSTQWGAASPITAGVPFCWAAMNTSAGQTEFVNSGQVAFVNTQTTANYDGVAAWGSGHSTGLPTRVAR
jgi:hypothetical protein